ncbi:hypothetical protein SLEP1_g26843 [Rubroshorea leprosula]|uniref:Secreted protein n=1 Tax=Rubroshorea leprosula TaxID=152421 RepID=A0AAV5JXQ7_9ROSI|nr:hypothetical protein SLEP1_g26843 [Rubroshorea leprosula]
MIYNHPILLFFFFFPVPCNSRKPPTHLPLRKPKIQDLLCSSSPAADFSLVRVGIFPVFWREFPPADCRRPLPPCHVQFCSWKILVGWLL